MGSLSQDDVAAVLDLTLTAYACEDLASFRAELLPALRRLVPADVLCYNELDLTSGCAIGIFDPADVTFTGLEQRFAATAHQHPGVVLAQRGDHRTHLLSELVTARELHRLDLYHEVYRPLETEDQIYVNLTAPAMVTVAINRSRRTFTPRDREMIELLEPHLRQAYVQAQLRERAHAVIAAQEAGLRETHAALILLDPAGAVIHASALGRQLLATYYPGQDDVGGVLPDSVADWLRASTTDTPHTLVIATSSGRLHLRALSGHTTEGWRAVLLDEHRDPAMPTATSLRTLGLTGRQAQVLQLLSAGGTTQDIADQLYLSPATVRKHLEHIYARLDVQSRTQAVAIAVHHR